MAHTARTHGDAPRAAIIQANNVTLTSLALVEEERGRTTPLPDIEAQRHQTKISVTFAHGSSTLLV